MTCVQTTSLGAYVLGALDTEDRQETERHLRECAPCRDELVRLAPLPGLLSQVSLSDLAAMDVEPRVDSTAPPPAPAVRSGRRGRARRIIGTAAAAAAVAAGFVVAGRVVVDDASPSTSEVTPSAATWSAESGPGRIVASAVLYDRGWGTDITLTMGDLPIGQRCRLVVRSVDGRVETAGWWTTGYASTAEVPASTSIDLASVDRLDVIRDDGRVLAVLSPSGPDGPSPAPASHRIPAPADPGRSAGW